MECGSVFLRELGVDKLLSARVSGRCGRGVDVWGDKSIRLYVGLEVICRYLQGSES